MPIDPKPHAHAPSSPLDAFQIDPYRGTALYRLLQGAAPTGEPFEVGWVHVTGTSRLDSVEHWLLYASVNDDAVTANRRAYLWPSGMPEPVGMHLHFVRTDPDLDPAQYKTVLEAGSGVTVLYIKATCAQQP